VNAKLLALLALGATIINAIAQFGMFLIHCRGDKRRFAELSKNERSTTT
jgi:hypothetical protein